ncbi:hypothetical protein QUB36_07845 [Microcoleus sp. AT8-B1]|uniref:hypothetical protein n=1 Tax=unclassified Microcoleus TaxID=2642155 RepID=UPI002FD3928B
MPLHIKASGQAGFLGNAVFDPVATNEYIKTELVKLGWQAGIKIPKMYRVLGKEVDLGSNGAIVEVQLSHYSFLLNNTVRSQVFFNTNTPLTGQPIRVVIIVTKSQIIPAANSTLYYEPTVNQLTVLSAYLFKMPLRIVGLFKQMNTTVPAILTDYSAPRSRTIVTQQECECQIISGRSRRSPSSIRIM